MTQQPLSLQTIRQEAPSVFATQPESGVSDRYRFIPTSHVMNVLDMLGWKPVSARQVISRADDGMSYAKHELRFQNDSSLNRDFLKVGDSIPQIILTNSHNRTAVFNLMAGLFRLVCSNGLMVSDAALGGIRVKHLGYDDSAIVDATFQITDKLPQVLNSLEKFKSTELSDTDQRIMARSAALLRWNTISDIPIHPDDLLRPRRTDDNHRDLFSTFNRLQENLIRGGIRAVNESGKRYRTKAIRSIDSDIEINQGLWTLAEKMLAMKQAA